MSQKQLRDDCDFLHRLIDYNPETGIALWKPRDLDMFKSGLPKHMVAWNKRYAGKPCGRLVSGGYLSTVVCGQRVMIHRLIWVLYHKEAIPNGAQIDHINGVPSDNRIANLRLSTPRQNQANIPSSSALRGAVYHKATGKWQSSIRLHLGTFETAEEAAAAYEFAAEKIHAEFYLPNGRRPTASRVL